VQVNLITKGSISFTQMNKMLPVIHHIALQQPGKVSGLHHTVKKLTDDSPQDPAE